MVVNALEKIDDQAVRDSFRTGVYERTPFESTAFELSVTGELPRELSGRYLRLGPNAFADHDPETYFWWSGAGMMHGVRLNNGRAEWYRSRLMRSSAVTEKFGLPPVPVPEGRSFGTAGTGPIVFRGKTYATEEAGAIPLWVSNELDPLEGEDFGGTLTGGFSGHCKIDPRTGELVAIVYDVMEWFTKQRKPHALVVSPDGHVRHETPLDVQQVTMMHDCWITENYIVAFEIPVRPAPELAEVMAVPFTWDPALPCRIGLVDRNKPSAPQRWFDIEPCAIFHTLSGYEEGDKIVLEAFRFDRLFDKDKVGFGESSAFLYRWTLNLSTGACEEELIDERPGELGVIDPRRVGVYNRYGYWTGYSVGPHNSGENRQLAFSFDTICKIDRKTGEIARAAAPEGHVYGEMFFVPRSSDADEDDGWLMGFRYRLDGGNTDLMVFSAKDITADPVATVHLPVRVPMGFHGWWGAD